MVIFKCKMCGGNLEVTPDMSVGTCEHCGSTMPLPRLPDEARANLFNRANHFRRQRLLIPCYKDMDAYDIPEELSHLQSQDMSKIGFIQDLLRGVKKVLDAGKTTKTAAPVTQKTSAGETGEKQKYEGRRGWAIIS